MKVLDTPLFGFLLTIIAYWFGGIVHKKTKSPILNPIVIAIGSIIVLLLSFNIDYEIYNKGGSIITFFLGPATVILAVPLYRQIDKLKGNSIPILCGILVGSVTSIASVIVLGKIFGLEKSILLSLVPKSATTAISQEISAQTGGVPAITVAATAFTGIMGNVVGAEICGLFRIKDDVSVGVALGTTSHAIGTAKAMELGETQGAMGSLSISLAGIATVFLTPWLLKIFSLL